MVNINIKEKEQNTYPYSIKIHSYNVKMFKQLVEKLKDTDFPILVSSSKNIIQFVGQYCTEKTFEHYLRTIDKFLKQLEPEVDRIFLNKLDVEDIIIVDSKFMGI